MFGNLNSKKHRQPATMKRSSKPAHLCRTQRLDDLLLGRDARAVVSMQRGGPRGDDLTQNAGVLVVVVVVGLGCWSEQKIILEGLGRYFWQLSIWSGLVSHWIGYSLIYLTMQTMLQITRCGKVIPFRLHLGSTFQHIFRLPGDSWDRMCFCLTVVNGVR